MQQMQDWLEVGLYDMALASHQCCVRFPTDTPIWGLLIVSLITKRGCKELSAPYLRQTHIRSHLPQEKYTTVRSDHYVETIRIPVEQILATGHHFGCVAEYFAVF